MSANDSLLFIDSNKYLDFYRRDLGKRQLESLVEQVDSIFITQQVLSEIQRNKLVVAADFCKKKSESLKLKNCQLPECLFNTNIDILQQMPKSNKEIEQVNDKVDDLMLKTLKQISRSEDEVSKSLSPIFAKAVLHSAEELQRAKERRELGNPPGKSNNPLGDQLTWEQILTHFKGKKRLWIISSDNDYGTFYKKKNNNYGYLNCFLYDELCNVGNAPEVYLFDELHKGLEHFIDTTAVKAEKRLTSEELEEISKEEEYLLSLNTNPQIPDITLEAIIAKSCEINGEDIRRRMNEELEKARALSKQKNKNLERMQAQFFEDMKNK